MKLSNQNIKKIVDKIVQGLRPEKVILFGSYATGCATDNSDLDLLVIMKSDKPSYKRSAAVRSLLWPPKVAMDILVYSPEEIKQVNGLPNHVVTDALETGKVLYAV